MPLPRTEGDATGNAKGKSKAGTTAGSRSSRSSRVAIAWPLHASLSSHVKPCQAVEARRRDGKNGKGDRSEDPHEKALHEERSLLCVGLPSLWTAEQTKDFFSQYEGEVEAVYVRETQTAVHLLFEANCLPETLVLPKAYTGPTLL